MQLGIHIEHMELMRTHISRGLQLRLSEILWSNMLFEPIIAPSQIALSQSLSEVETLLENYIYANNQLLPHRKVH
jgi:hypothetical protein